MTIISGQYLMYMPQISGLFVSPCEYKLSDEEEEVLHRRVSVSLSNNHSMHIAE